MNRPPISSGWAFYSSPLGVSDTKLATGEACISVALCDQLEQSGRCANGVALKPNLPSIPLLTREHKI